jgi:hypothetical protein
MRRMLVFSLLALMAGCGASAQQEVAAVIRASDAAWARDDLEAVCSRMTEHARRHYADTDVRAAVCNVAEPNTRLVVQHLYISGPRSEPPRMTGIRVDGDTAVATYSNDDRSDYAGSTAAGSSTRSSRRYVELEPPPGSCTVCFLDVPRHFDGTRARPRVVTDHDPLASRRPT